MSGDKPTILFLCTANACRSQMAEALARQDFGRHFIIQSAGTHPAKTVDPLAVAVMKELGLDLSHHTPKALPSTYAGIDLVITLCDEARDQCPVPPPGVRHLHWSIPDPARQGGSLEERMAFYRKVRDEIARRIQQTLKEELRSRGMAQKGQLAP